LNFGTISKQIIQKLLIVRTDSVAMSLIIAR